MAGSILNGNIMTEQSEKLVLVGGCFDLIHFGHITFLEHAKKLGTRLIVALESDENVRHAKGENRPIHSQEQRAAMLSALKCVDEVIALPRMETDQQYKDLVLRIQPNIIAITEGDPIKQKKEMQAILIGADIVEIPKIHTPSPSQLTKLLKLK